MKDRQNISLTLIIKVKMIRIGDGRQRKRAMNEYTCKIRKKCLEVGSIGCESVKRS